jgi:hypothetical protein
LAAEIARYLLVVVLEMNARHAFLGGVAGFPLVGLAHSQG